MTKLVEMDEKVKFKEQIEEKEIDGQVILIDKFNVEPNKIEEFLKDWREDARMLVNLNNSLDLFLHNYIKALTRVLYSLITQPGIR